MDLFFLSFVAFIAGVLTFLAPCTLPILPVYLSICMKKDFRSLTLHTLYLAIGVAIVYIALGVFAGTLGSFVATHKTLFIDVTGWLLIITGIATLFGWSLMRSLPMQRDFSPLATVGYGALFGLAWSGCIGPVLGGILLIAGSTGTAFQGGFLLLLYSAGMLAPLFVISIVADRTKVIPKLWRFLYGKTFEWKLGKQVFIVHTTNLLTGALFLLLGIFFLLHGPMLLEGFSPAMMDRLLTLEDRLQSWVSSFR